jgi:hypothetical protein
MDTASLRSINDNKPTGSGWLGLSADLGWLAAIILVMATTSIWDLLSPRPEIGKVAVLWIPNAVLAVAFLRNWGRPVFCCLLLVLFYSVGLYTAFQSKTVVSASLYLTIDVIEAGLIALGLIVWFGKAFRMNSALNVSAFGVITAACCLVGSVLAAFVSHASIGNSPISQNAPLQVGIAWFTSDLATYFLVAAPLIAMTGRGGRHVWTNLKQAPVVSLLGALLVMLLTFAGFALPQLIASKTGLMLGSGGLILLAFPLATYLGFTRGPVIAALTGAAIGVPAIYATMIGLGPFGRGNTTANVFDMQATLIVCVFTLLLIGAMGDAMRERSAALERALDESIRARQNRT